MLGQVMAGFTESQADTLRNAIGKKKADLMAKVKKQFLKGSIEQGVLTKEESEEIISCIEKS